MENFDFLSAKMRIRIVIWNHSLRNWNMHDAPNGKKSPQNFYKIRMLVQHIMKCGINEPLLLNNKTKLFFILVRRTDEQYLRTIFYRYNIERILTVKYIENIIHANSKQQLFEKIKI